MGGPLFYIVFDSNCFQVALFLTFSRLASGGPIFSHLNALRAAVWREAYGLAAQKWGKKPLGGIPQTPVFCPIGLYRRRYRAATEILPGRWPLVIGAVSV